MAQLTPELRAAIDVAKQRVKVDTYYPKAMNAGLKGNAQGFWSGTALGFGTGALTGGLIVGAIALFSLPVTLPAYAIILGLASIGGTAGGVTGARIGAGSAAVAGVAAERERRDKADALEQEIMRSPDKQREVISAYRQNPVVEKDDTAGEIVATSRIKGQAFRKIVDWKTMIVTVAICAVASMALFGGAFLLAGGPLLGMAAGTGIASGLGSIGMTSLGASLGIGAAAGSAMGISFGVAYPPLFANLTKRVADLLSTKMVRGQSGFERTKTAAEMEHEAVVNRQHSDVIQAAAGKPLMEAAPLTQVNQAMTMDRVAQPQQQVAI